MKGLAQASALVALVLTSGNNFCPGSIDYIFSGWNRYSGHVTKW